MKFSYWILALFLFPVILASCDNEGDVINTEFYPFKITFKDPTLKDSYRILFDGKEVRSDAYVPRQLPSGLLEVYEKNSDVLEYSKNVEINKSRTAIELIKIPNRPFDIYSEDTYISYKVDILYDKSIEDNYQAYFNDVPLNNGKENYLKKDEAAGLMKICEKSTGKVLFSQKMTLLSGERIYIMQLDASEFMYVEDDKDESDPESRRYAKLRFFYTADVFPGVKSLKLVLYSTPDPNGLDGFEEQGSIDINAGQLSDYFLFDREFHGQEAKMLVYDLINTETGEKIVDNTIHTNTYIGFPDEKGYKFQTYRIKLINPSGEHAGDNILMDFNKDLSTPWE